MATLDWYYDYYECGTFPHQQKLCESVTWTKHNLEGQLLRQTSLTKSSGNPLTIRLLAVKEALNQLTDYIGELDSEIKAHSKKQFETKKYSGMGSTFYGKGNSNDTGAAPMEVIKFDGEDIKLTIKYIVVQSALYKFFTNFGSVIDRLANEIELIYGLNEKKIDWTKLIDTRPKHDKVWGSLYEKDKQLALLVKKYSPYFEKAFYFRNRLVHVGLVDFDVKYRDQELNRGLYIILAGNSDEISNNIEINAVKLCTQIKRDLLELLDKSYELMIQYSKTFKIVEGGL